MYTGSPYITNISSRKYVSAECDVPLIGKNVVSLFLKYDDTQVNKVKFMCTPTAAFASSIYDNYRNMKPCGWGFVEQSQNKGDIVQVVVQGRVPVNMQETGSGSIGRNIAQILKNSWDKYVDDFYLNPKVTPTTDPGSFTGGYTGSIPAEDNSLRQLAGSAGVISKVGVDGEIIIWQGVSIPSILNYSQGQSYRIQAELKGVVGAGCPVLLYPHSTGDLHAFNCPVSRNTSWSNSQFQFVQGDDRYFPWGKWGICETGGVSGDVVDIVIAGHAQTANVGMGNKVLGDATFESYSTGDIHGTDGWRKYFNATDSAAGTMEFQSGGAYEGDKTLDVTITNDGDSSGDVQLYNMATPNDGSMQLSENVDYKFSCWAKCSESNRKVTVDILDGIDYTRDPATTVDGTPGQFLFTPTADWTKFECVFQITDRSIQYARLNFFFGQGTGGSSDNTGVFKFDNISLIEDPGEPDTGYLLGGIGYSGYLYKHDQNTRDYRPTDYGTIVNDTGMICINPGVGAGEIKDYKEKQIVKARAWSTVTTRNEKAVSLWVDEFGDLNCITDTIPSTEITAEERYDAPEGKWGIQLDTSAADKAWVDVLVRGRLEDAAFNTFYDGTPEIGDYMAQITQDGNVHMEHAKTYEVIPKEANKTLGAASDWREYSPGEDTDPSITFAAQYTSFTSTCDTVKGSHAVDFTNGTPIDTSGEIGQLVTGTGIDDGTFISSIDTSANTLQLSKVALSSNTSTLTFSPDRIAITGTGNADLDENREGASLGLNGDENITHSKNRLMDEDTDWIEYSPGTGLESFTEDHAGEERLVISPTTSTDKQGCELTTSYLDTIVAGEYTVKCKIYSASGTIDNFKIDLGGASSSAFSITTDTSYIYKSVVATGDGNLRIYNEDANATDWYVEEVFVYEKIYSATNPILIRRVDNWNLWDPQASMSGHFDWALHGWDADNNKLVAKEIDGGTGNIYQTGNPTIVNNQTYQVNYTISKYRGGQFQAQLYSGTAGGTGYRHGLGAIRTENGTFSEIITINQDDGGSNNKIWFQGSTTYDFTVSDISVINMDREGLISKGDYLVTADLWSVSNTNPAELYASYFNRNTYKPGSYGPIDYQTRFRFLDNGDSTLTTQPRTAQAMCFAHNDWAHPDGLNIFQGNAVNTQWFFRNVSIKYLGGTHNNPLAMCLNTNKKEWYIF